MGCVLLQHLRVCDGGTFAAAECLWCVMYFAAAAAAVQKQFPNKAAFLAELSRMFANCRRYNGPSTIYYKYANELEKFIWPKALQIQDTQEPAGAPASAAAPAAAAADALR